MAAMGAYQGKSTFTQHQLTEHFLGSNELEIQSSKASNASLIIKGLKKRDIKSVTDLWAKSNKEKMDAIREMLNCALLPLGKTMGKIQPSPTPLGGEGALYIMGMKSDPDLLELFTSPFGFKLMVAKGDITTRAIDLEEALLASPEEEITLDPGQSLCLTDVPAQPIIDHFKTHKAPAEMKIGSMSRGFTFKTEKTLHLYSSSDGKLVVKSTGSPLKFKLIPLNLAQKAFAKVFGGLYRKLNSESDEKE